LPNDNIDLIAAQQQMCDAPKPPANAPYVAYDPPIPSIVFPRGHAEVKQHVFMDSKAFNSALALSVDFRAITPATNRMLRVSYRVGG
jgi:hypothetical protein